MPRTLRALAAPRGGAFPLGAARRGKEPPCRARYARLLPPEGALFPWDGPAGKGYFCEGLEGTIFAKVVKARDGRRPEAVALPGVAQNLLGTFRTLSDPPA